MSFGHFGASHGSLARPLAIVAIPANNEAERIEACLAALAAQRDRFGAPLQNGCFEVLVFANNCIDGTVDAINAFARDSALRVIVYDDVLARERSNAGWARKRAMDLAATTLCDAGRHDGIILTTDADSIVGPTWIDATIRSFAEGVDAVAGYVDALPSELARLGRAFVNRGRLEDHYLRLVAELYAICDPRSHDPWPNHRVSSGASLAVSLRAYRAIGGLPPKPLGEDAALTDALERAGFKVRHAMDVCVSTSCRLDGRAEGGAADTMRHRQEVEEAPCDDDLEPALATLRRALWKGRLRRMHEEGTLAGYPWSGRLGLETASTCVDTAALACATFEEFWAQVVRDSRVLRAKQSLRPSDLPREITRAAACLAALGSDHSEKPARQTPAVEQSLASSALQGNRQIDITSSPKMAS